MPDVKSKEPCTICLHRYSIMHSHHTVPQSCGGQNSRQIILCPTCHNNLHAEALHITSALKRGKSPPPKSFWNNGDDLERARPFVGIIVKAFMSMSPDSRRHMIQLELTTQEYHDMVLLQRDLGIRSQEEVLKYCLQQVLIRKGLSNDRQKDRTMWHLPVSTKRQGV